MNKAFFSNKNQDDFIKYGKYEMRIRDKMLIENDYMTKAKVKWRGGKNCVFPYHWKVDKSNTNYQESWGDPREAKTQKDEKKIESPAIQKKNQWRKIFEDIISSNFSISNHLKLSISLFSSFFV